MAIRTRTERPKKSEFELILEFIGYKTIAVAGIGGALYFVSGYTVFRQGRSFWEAFSPYYALRFHDGGRIINAFFENIGDWIRSAWDFVIDSANSLINQGITTFQTKVEPFLQENPALAIPLFIAVGAGAFVLLLMMLLYVFKRIFAFLPTAALSPKKKSKNDSIDEIWSYDPSKKPSEEQMRKMLKNLERLIQHAPAMSGSVPKDADISLRTLASRNQNSEYTHRYAVYVMGPIKGTNFDNGHELPLALDQIKKITRQMGKSAEYENLPIDLMMLRALKGKKEWEVVQGVKPIKCGNLYPIKMVEQAMSKYRNYFIWDGRAKKSLTGYGTRG